MQRRERAGLIAGVGPVAAAFIFATVAAAPTRAAAPEKRTSGADVYRLNCRSCHGEDGLGTNRGPSLAEAVRALSPGPAASGDPAASAGAKAERRSPQEAERRIRERLASGGKQMPSFGDLDRSEANALLAYLRALGSGDSSAETPSATAPSGAALGERIYRKNCASCHEAASASEGMMACCRPESLRGATQRFSQQQVSNLLDRGVCTMPSFGYLSADERDALWAFLETLAPGQEQNPTMGQRCPMVQAAMEGKAMGCPMMARSSDDAAPSCCR